MMSNISPADLGQPEIIETKQALQKLVSTLRNARLMAVDTESNSMYAYYEQVCLIQLSACFDQGEFARGHDYIIDPLAIDDLSALGELFADPRIEVVFHAAEYDIMSLKRDFNFEFCRLFDTYIAARVLGWEQVGLAALLETNFGVHQDKSMQQADWSRRPLSANQLYYAQLDTHFLPALRFRLAKELEQQGLLEEAYEYFQELVSISPAQKVFDPDGFWRIRGPRDLQPGELAILRELYLWREQLAERRNLPPFKIMQNPELAAIAVAMPQNLHDLRQIRGVSQCNVDRYRHEILRVVKTARRSPPPKPRLHPQPAPDVRARFEALQEWRKQKAELRGVGSDIILSKAALWALAHCAPTSLVEFENIDEIGPYRRQKYAVELLEVLAKVTG